MTVSGGYGDSASGTTDSNGYFNIELKPTNIGGPYDLHFNLTSTYGDYNTTQGSLTVTAPITVPTDKVLEGTVIAGQTGTMPNRAGDTPALASSITGTTIKLRPSAGYRDGIDDTVSVSSTTLDSDLKSSNIVSGVNILGVTGSASGASVFTAVADRNVNYRIYGDDTQNSKALTYASPTTVKAFRIAVAGSITTWFEIESNCSGRIYVNGSPYGSTHTVSGNWSYYSDTIYVSPGDLVELRVWGSSVRYWDLGVYADMSKSLFTRVQ